ncbi:MAG: ABC transporter ATP-binding protein [Clostridiales bacterium]|nr:ABC transporter ATP-binding protein [Clostridiales bacterium]
MPEIILENVTKRFGKSMAVDDMSLQISDRSFVSLLGPSGCGKTTILRMITGLETPTQGNIYIDGKLVFSTKKGVNVSASRRGVGFLFQNYALWPHMTVYKNIAFGLENLRWKKGDIRSRVSELLAMLKIEEFEKRYPSELSGGQQQRVAIARTLATGSKILFMDEPLSNLDAKLRNEMRVELKRLHEETDSTFVYVTHDQLEAMTLSTKICLMKIGVVQQYAVPLDIYNKPANTFVADFVGNPPTNFVDAKVTETRGDGCVLAFGNNAVTFIPVESDREPHAGQDVILGVRPEFIKISDDGDIDGEIYSTLPSGMETVLKIDIGSSIITAVIFGSVEYFSRSKVKLGFATQKLFLFDKADGNKIAIGRIANNRK